MAKKKAGSPSTRKIDGKNFKLKTSTTKPKAKTSAKASRKAGKQARVVRASNGKYGVYTRG